MKNMAVTAALALAISVVPVHAAAIVAGQTDTFQDLTTDGWFAGGGPKGSIPPTPPQVVPNGGPSGASDAFLEVTATGGTGAGSRLVAINSAQWAGDYLAAGITGISIDLLNLGTVDLTIRLLLEDPLGGPPADEAVTTFGVFLPVGIGWTAVFFPLGIGDLTVLAGDASALLSHTTLLRIIDAPTAGAAVPIAGVLGVDNIHAAGASAAIPEPATLALFGLGLAGLAASRRCKLN